MFRKSVVFSYYTLSRNVHSYFLPKCRKNRENAGVISACIGLPVSQTLWRECYCRGMLYKNCRVGPSTPWNERLNHPSRLKNHPRWKVPHNTKKTEKLHNLVLSRLGVSKNVIIQSQGAENALFVVNQLVRLLLLSNWRVSFYFACVSMHLFTPYRLGSPRCLCACKLKYPVMLCRSTCKYPICITKCDTAHSCPEVSFRMSTYFLACSFLGSHLILTCCILDQGVIWLFPLHRVEYDVTFLHTVYSYKSP